MMGNMVKIVIITIMKIFKKKPIQNTKVKMLCKDKRISCAMS